MTSFRRHVPAGNPVYEKPRRSKEDTRTGAGAGACSDQQFHKHKLFSRHVAETLPLSEINS